MDNTVSLRVYSRQICPKSRTFGPISAEYQRYAVEDGYEDENEDDFHGYSVSHQSEGVKPRIA